MISAALRRAATRPPRHLRLSHCHRIIAATQFPAQQHLRSSSSLRSFSITNDTTHQQQQQQQQRHRPMLGYDSQLTILSSSTLQEEQEKQQQPKSFSHLFSDPSVSWSSVVSQAWILLSKQTQKLPKGFENFFPKNSPLPPPSESDKEKSPGEQSSPKDDGKNVNKTFSKDKKKEEKKKTDRGDDQDPNNNNDPQNIPGLLVMLALLIAFRTINESNEVGGSNNPNKKEVTFQEFRREYLLKGKVDSIQVVNKHVAKVYLKDQATAPTLLEGHEEDEMAHSSHHEYDSHDDSTDDSPGLSSQQQPHMVYFFIGSVEALEEKLTKAQQHWHPADWVDVQYVTQTNYALEALKVLPMLATLVALYYGTRGLSGGVMGGGKGGGAGGGGGIFSIGKSNAKKISPSDVKTNFSDVAGCQQAKQEIMEFVDFLKNPLRFSKLGAKIPKGALLCGPPGTGKTLLAKAVAGEAGVPFYSISGSDFIEMFVGVGPSRVRDLFKEARQNSPCIVFIDEIDAVGRQRGRGGFSGGNDERENTLNQLLVEMDGFSSTTNIVVLAGTNRADILDQALTRPGRFDRQIQVDKPDLQGRKEIFMVHLRGLTLEGEKEDYAGRLAGLTPGFAGADIANLCNEAAIVAARRKAESVGIADFEKATDRIIGGLESNKIISDQEKDIVAHHEAGHAVAGWFLEHADPLLKVTIIPRTSGALGFAQYLPKEVFLRSREQIMDIVCMALAGRAAEQVFFGQITTGASDDLRRVTQLVYSTIKDFGMNSRLGQLSFPSDDNSNPGDKPYSESTAEAMDEEARTIVDEAYQRTIDLITEHKEDVAKIAGLLREKETITHDDIVEIIGKRPYGDKAYDEYVSSKAGISKKAENDSHEDSNEDDTPPMDDDTTTFTPGLA